MQATFSEEYKEDGEVEDTLTMCRYLKPYAEPFNRRVFPRYPDAHPVDETVSVQNLLLLFNYHCTLSNAGEFEHEPYTNALDEALERRKSQ